MSSPLEEGGVNQRHVVDGWFPLRKQVLPKLCYLKNITDKGMLRLFIIV